MSLSGFQSALCDAIASPQLARRLGDTADDLVGSYDLSARERRRLVSMVRQRGLQTSSAIYRLNRVTPLCEYLPMSATLLGDELVAHAQDYWATHGTDLQFAPEVAGFGSFLTERLRAGAVSTPYLAEILAFELAINDIKFATGNRQIRVVPFAHEPGTLLESLTRGVVPDDVAAGEHYLLVDARDGGLRVVPMEPQLAVRLLDLQAGATFDPDRDEDIALARAGLIDEAA